MGLGGNYLTQKLILERLDRQQFEPIVVAPMDGIALEQFRSMGVECFVIPPSDALSRYGRKILKAGFLDKARTAVGLIRYNLLLRRFLKTHNVNVVYANCVRAQLSIGPAAKSAGVPSLLYVKGELENPFLDRLCFMLADKILFFCSQNRDDKYPFWVRWFARKIDILKIGMDLSVIRRAEQSDHERLRTELEIDPSWHNAAVLAQLYHPKGQHFAIEALARLIAEYPRTRLYLLGDHVLEEYRPYKAELDRLISRLGLQDHVRFTGWRRDALEIASLMDLVIHPSLAEGFGRAVLEAMALGKPVIASAVGGLREAIQDGRNGYLVAPGDVESIVQRWRVLLSNQEVRENLGREARRTVLENYLIDDKVTRLAQIWTEMASGRH